MKTLNPHNISPSIKILIRFEIYCAELQLIKPSISGSLIDKTETQNCKETPDIVFIVYQNSLIIFHPSGNSVTWCFRRCIIILIIKFEFELSREVNQCVNCIVIQKPV